MPSCASWSMCSVLPQASARCSIWPLVARSTQQVQINRVKCDVVDSKLRFNCVSTRHKVGQMVRLLLQRLQEARQCLARTFVCCERTIGYCPMRRCKETITSRRGISDATRANGTLTECIGCLLLIWI